MLILRLLTVAVSVWLVVCLVALLKPDRGDALAKENLKRLQRETDEILRGVGAQPIKREPPPVAEPKPWGVYAGLAAVGLCVLVAAQVWPVRKERSE